MMRPADPVPAPPSSARAERSRRPRRGALRLLAVLVALASPGAACRGGGNGDGDGDDGGFADNGGIGTGTLRIIAALSVDEDGDFQANVNLANAMNQVVSGATVVLRTPDQGDLTLVEEPAGFGTYVLPPGAWDYAAGFGLEVDGGAEGNAHGIGFDAPDLTQVLFPESQDTLPLGQDATVTWAGRGAEQHRLTLTVNDYDSGWTDGDPGSAVIPAAVLTTAAVETLTVRRRKEIDITSGRPGSVFKAELRDVVEPLGLQ